MHVTGLICSAVRVTVLALAVAGCYTRRPITAAAPAPSTRIIARLTDVGVVQMAPVIGGGVYEIEGVVAEADTSVWKLHVTRVEQRTGSSIMWNREIVPFPRVALTDATEKRLDKGRSWMAAGLVAAGAVLAAIAFGELGADQETNPPPPPPNIRIPGGGFRIGF